MKKRLLLLAVVLSTGPALPPEFNNGTDSHYPDGDQASGVPSKPDFSDLTFTANSSPAPEAVLLLDTQGRIYLRGKLIGQDDELGKTVQKGICK